MLFINNFINKKQKNRAFNVLVEHTIIFCISLKSTQILYHYLQSAKLQILSVHPDYYLDTRSDNMAIP